MVNFRNPLTPVHNIYQWQFLMSAVKYITLSYNRRHQYLAAATADEVLVLVVGVCNFVCSQLCYDVILLRGLFLTVSTILFCFFFNF